MIREFKTINGVYAVQPDGTIDLGPEYGFVAVKTLTVNQARETIKKYLRDEIGLADASVAVSIPRLGLRQPISGEHEVLPDGRVALGIYGSVNIKGMSLDKLKYTIDARLADFVYEPNVSVRVVRVAAR